MRCAHRRFHLVAALAAILLLGSVPAALSASVPATVSLSGAFTYQGQLTLNGAAFTGACDFQFSLWDAATGGSQVGATDSAASVAVTNGLFMTTLNASAVFGADPFDGSARWLELAVRCPAGSGSYTTLAPRQAITATPYAIYAPSAGNAAQLGGRPTGDFIYTAGPGLNLNANQFSVVTSTVQARVSGSCASGGSLRAIAADGSVTCQKYANIVIVDQNGGGDFTSIGPALASITSASATNPYLIVVAPGVYNESLTMKPYVDITGSGEDVTTIAASGSASPDTGTVVGAASATLRFLTIQNTGGGAANAIALYDTGGASPALFHVSLTASGAANNYGVYTAATDQTATFVQTIQASSVAVTGGANAYGLYNAFNLTGGDVGLRDYLTQTVQGTAISVQQAVNAYGLYNASVSTCSGCGPIGNTLSVAVTLDDSTISVAGGGSGYAAYNYATVPASGINNSFPISLIILNSTLTAASNANNYAVYNTASGGGNNLPLTILAQNSTLSAGGGTASYGIYDQSASTSSTVKVLNSRVAGATATLRSAANFANRVGASQLDGGAVDTSGGGTATCAGVYDENFVFSVSVCP